MESRRKRINSVKSHLISPFIHIFKPKVEDTSKKPLTINLLSSYLRYKKHPLSENFKKDLNYFLKSNHFKNNSSSLLLKTKNFMDSQKVDIRNYEKNTRNYRIINNKKENKSNNFDSINNLNKFKNNSITLHTSHKYKKKYEYLMRNLSFRGNNSYSSLKNISNNDLDDIFKHTPYISYDATHIKVIDKFQKKYKTFFKRISKKYKEESKSEKKIVDSSPKSRDIKSCRAPVKSKNIEFENKILNKLNEPNYYKESYFDYKNFNPKFLILKRTRIQNEIKKYESNEYLSKSKSNSKSKETRNKYKTEYYENFQNIKKKLKRVNEVKDKILKDIQKQQSLSKHNIQVSIVKFNQYKVKLRQMRRRYDLFH